MSFYQAFAYRQPEANTLSQFGGSIFSFHTIKRLEYALPFFERNTRPLVRDADTNVLLPGDS